jgi:hypothetical protein
MSLATDINKTLHRLKDIERRRIEGSATIEDCANEMFKVETLLRRAAIMAQRIEIIKVAIKDVPT